MEQLNRTKNCRTVSLKKELLRLLVKIFIILISLISLFRFVFGIQRYTGEDMSPNIRDGDLILYFRPDRNFTAGDVVMLTDPEGKQRAARVIAVHKDTVDITEEGLKINDSVQTERMTRGKTHAYEKGRRFPLTVSTGEVFVLGDNREHATDSRIFGCVDAGLLKGKVIGILRRRDF